MLLHLVLLLMHSVQVSFIPGSEMLPFSRKTSDPVGRPVVFQQQRWDKLLLDQLALLVLALMFFVHVN